MSGGLGHGSGVVADRGGLLRARHRRSYSARARDRARRRGPSARDGRRRGRGAGRGPRRRARRWRRRAGARADGASPDDARCSHRGYRASEGRAAADVDADALRERRRQCEHARRAWCDGAERERERDHHLPARVHGGIRAGAARFSAADDARRARLRRPPCGVSTGRVRLARTSGVNKTVDASTTSTPSEITRVVRPSVAVGAVHVRRIAVDPRRRRTPVRSRSVARSRPPREKRHSSALTGADDERTRRGMEEARQPSRSPA